MKKEVILLIISIFAIVGLLSGCIENNNAGNTANTNPTITVQGKIIDFRPISRISSGATLDNLVYLIFEDGQVYCVVIDHFRLNATVKIEMQKYAYSHMSGMTVYEVTDYKEIDSPVDVAK